MTKSVASSDGLKGNSACDSGRQGGEDLAGPGQVEAHHQFGEMAGGLLVERPGHPGHRGEVGRQVDVGPQRGVGQVDAVAGQVVGGCFDAGQAVAGLAQGGEGADVGEAERAAVDDQFRHEADQAAGGPQLGAVLEQDQRAERAVAAHGALEAGDQSPRTDQTRRRVRQRLPRASGGCRAPPPPGIPSRR